MSSVRLFVAPESLQRDRLELDGDNHHYLFRVRRLKAGAEVVLFDGQGREASATVESVGPTQASLHLGPVRESPQPATPSLSVVLALIKGDRMDWCIQKLVELGVGEIRPFQAARSVVRLSGERAQARQRRWESIARDAARQCRRASVPDVAAVAALPDALDQVANAPLRLLFWEHARDRSLRAALAASQAPDRIALLLGPEGGLTPEEVDRAIASGFVPVGLGPRVLRAETAAVAAVSALGYALGDLG